MRSLQARLGVSLAISLVALFILEWFVVSPAIRKLTDDYVISRLRLDAASLLALVTITEDGKPQVDASRLEPLYRRPLSGHYFQVVTADGHTAQSRSLWDEAFPWVMQQMGAHEVSVMPVVSRGGAERLIGVLTMADIVRAYAQKKMQ